MFESKSGKPIKVKPWHKEAVKMNLSGFGATDIAKRLLGRSTQESTVRDFLTKLNADSLVVKELFGDPVIGSEEGLDCPINSLKVLFWDIETSPALSAHWGLYDQRIAKGATVRKAGLLSHAWSWGNGQVHSGVLTPEQAIENDYEDLVYKAWSLLDNADVVVAHNGKNFDIKRINAEFIKIGLPPPSPYKVYDTLRVAKRHFKFERNDLDSLCEILGVPFRKVKHEGMPLWMKCIQGEQESLDQMQEYNEGDIPTLRAVFYKLLPWDNQGINFSLLLNDEDSCPHCGADVSDVEDLTDKSVLTASRKYAHYRCSSCGANLRSKSPTISTSPKYSKV